jgi:hypothetical protein
MGICEIIYFIPQFHQIKVVEISDKPIKAITNYLKITLNQADL